MVYDFYVFLMGFSGHFQAIFANETIPRSLEDDAVFGEKRRSRSRHV